VGGAERFLAMASGPPVAWSPDGKQIAYVGEPHGHLDIAVIGIDGTGQRLLTDDSASDSFPAWSPDGKWIAFANDLTFTREYLDGDEIFVVKVDGSGRRRLTDNKANDLAPAWKPAS
jgi:TolB protein